MEGGSCRRVGWAQIWEHERWGDEPLLAVVRQLVSESSVPESGVWVGLGVAFLWVLYSFSLGWRRGPGRAVRWGGGGVVSFCSVCLGFCRLMGLSKGMLLWQSRSKQAFHLFKQRYFSE